MSLFRLDASILPASSASRALADIVEAEWTASHPDSTVTRRDLASDPVPATAWADAVTGGFVDEAQRTSAQNDARALATRFADELIGADALLFAVPLYNYGVSQHFKTWFDLSYTDSRIDPTGTALNGKPATLVTVLGGNYAAGSPKDVWGLDLRVVQRPFTLVGVNPALDAFADTARELKENAESDARTYGRELAATRDPRVA
jgi:FMN-dependent NADH-azoreductase